MHALYPATGQKCSVCWFPLSADPLCVSEHRIRCLRYFLERSTRSFHTIQWQQRTYRDSRCSGATRFDRHGGRCEPWDGRRVDANVDAQPISGYGDFRYQFRSSVFDRRGSLLLRDHIAGFFTWIAFAGAAISGIVVYVLGTLGAAGFPR